MRFRSELRWLFYLTLVCIFALWIGCSDSRASVLVQFNNPDGSASPEVRAQTASTESERRLGLMYRKDMGEREGMIFVFPGETERSFWMKNTYLELDIIFMDSDFRVVSISERAVPLSETPRPSKGAAKYVLEVRGGLAESWGVRIGSTLQVRGELPEPK